MKFNKGDICVYKYTYPEEILQCCGVYEDFYVFIDNSQTVNIFLLHILIIDKITIQKYRNKV